MESKSPDIEVAQAQAVSEAAPIQENDLVVLGQRTRALAAELAAECLPRFSAQQAQAAFAFAKDNAFVPHVPPLFRPGWLRRYVVGPYDKDWLDGLTNDILAGLTVSLTLIPQALSYATLAGLPPVYGLYSAIVPVATYVLLGSSMQLAVGPTAVLSLLTGNVLSKYGADYTKDLDFAVDIAAQCAFQAGLVLFIASFFNLGNLIRFISHPVLSGFTTGAAMTIGLNQIKSAFGFGSQVPNVGPSGQVQYNYGLMKWYLQNWDGEVVKKHVHHLYRNQWAVKICFGLLVPMMIIQFFKKIVIRSSPERERKLWFKLWTLFTNVTPLIAIIIGARLAKDIRQDSTAYYASNLKIVGTIPQGLSILRTPKFREPFGSFFLDIIPLTLVLYMESYGIARKTAVDYGSLSFLSASQEMFSVGAANMLGCVSSSYPVCGSFSRSALNANSGGKTQLSSMVTLFVIITVTASLTRTLYWIPNAALAAVILVALLNLIDLKALWNAWKYSKKDFLVMFATLTFTFVFETGVGLAVGITLSVALLLRDMAFQLQSKPVAKSVDMNGVIVIRLHSNLVFINGSRIKDALQVELFESERNIKAIVLDFIDVHHVDLSGLISMREVVDDARKRGIPVVISNVLDEIKPHISKINIRSDKIVDEKLLLAIEAAMPMVGRATDEERGLEQESIATAERIIRDRASTNENL